MLDEKAIDSVLAGAARDLADFEKFHEPGVGRLGVYLKADEWHSLLALASFGLKAKAFLEEHGVHTSAGLGLMRVNALTLEDVKRRAAIIDHFQTLLESARALTEAKGGK